MNAEVNSGNRKIENSLVPLEWLALKGEEKKKILSLTCPRFRTGTLTNPSASKPIHHATTPHVLNFLCSD